MSKLAEAHCRWKRGRHLLGSRRRHVPCSPCQYWESRQIHRRASRRSLQIPCRTRLWRRGCKGACEQCCGSQVEAHEKQGVLWPSSRHARSILVSLPGHMPLHVCRRRSVSLTATEKACDSVMASAAAATQARSTARTVCAAATMVQMRGRVPEADTDDCLSSLAAAASSSGGTTPPPASWMDANFLCCFPDDGFLVPRAWRRASRT